MRFFVKSLFVMGCLAIGGAVLLAFDMSVTDEHRANLRSAVGDYVDTEAQRYEEGEYTSRSERKLGRLFSSVSALKNGIFRSEDFDLPAARPAAPTGWERTEYMTAHGQQITGAKMQRTPLFTTTTNGILQDFEEATANTWITTSATYQTKGAMVALRMVGDMKAIRAAEKGQWRQVAKPSVPFATLHGHVVTRQPAISHNAQGDTVAVPYQRFTMDLDGLVEIEILANGTDEQTLQVISGIDIPSILAGFPTRSGS